MLNKINHHEIYGNVKIITPNDEIISLGANDLPRILENDQNYCCVLN